jgi:hypothetical protein
MSGPIFTRGWLCRNAATLLNDPAVSLALGKASKNANQETRRIIMDRVHRQAIEALFDNLCDRGAPVAST